MSLPTLRQTVDIGNIAAATITLLAAGNVPTTITDGRKTVAAAATAERLVATSTPCKAVIITAEVDNTGVIVVGASTVVAALGTRRGVPLTANGVTADSVTIAIDDANEIFLDTTVNGDGVTFVILT